MEQTFLFDYHFASGIGCWEGGRYNKQIDMYITIENDEGNQEKLIGKVQFQIIYVDQAMEDGYDLYEIFDQKEHTFKLGQDIFDFEVDNIQEDIKEYYDDDFLQSNICILERIEILPEFRSKKLGAKAIKDIIFHFGSSCGLFVGQVFPLQLEPADNDENVWRKSLELNKFSSDEEISFINLKNYYLSMGFDAIPKYKNLIFLNPLRRNDIMDAINLED